MGSTECQKKVDIDSLFGCKEKHYKLTHCFQSFFRFARLNKTFDNLNIESFYFFLQMVIGIPLMILNTFNCQNNAFLGLQIAWWSIMFSVLLLIYRLLYIKVAIFPVFTLPWNVYRHNE